MYGDFFFFFFKWTFASLLKYVLWTQNSNSNFAEEHPICDIIKNLARFIFSTKLIVSLNIRSLMLLFFLNYSNILISFSFYRYYSPSLLLSH